MHLESYAGNKITNYSVINCKNITCALVTLVSNKGEIISTYYQLIYVI